MNAPPRKAVALRYDQEGADELVFYDITASAENRPIVDLAQKVSEQVFIPLTVGGGIRTFDDIRQILKLDWVRDEGDEVELHFYRCPLVFGWQRMGLDSAMIERLCRIAHQVDFGNVESHGFVLDMEPGLGHGEERCVLKVSKKK